MHVAVDTLGNAVQSVVDAEFVAPQAVSLLATQLLPAAVPDKWKFVAHFVILQAPEVHVAVDALANAVQSVVVAEFVAAQAVSLLATQLLPAAVPDR